MNKETEDHLNETFDWLQKTGGEIQNFASEQVPLYAQELVEFHIWNHSIIAGTQLLGAVIMGVAAFFTTRFLIRTRNHVRCVADKPVGTVFLTLALYVAICFSLVGVVDSGREVAKAVVAPRVIIIEHLRGL